MPLARGPPRTQSRADSLRHQVAGVWSVVALLSPGAGCGGKKAIAAEPGPPSAPREVPRDPFPVLRWQEPVVHWEQLAGVSARTSRRIRFSQRKAQDVGRAIQGVKSLYTGRPGPPPGLLSRPKLSLAQESFLSNIQSSVEALGPPPADLTHDGGATKAPRGQRL